MQQSCQTTSSWLFYQISYISEHQKKKYACMNNFILTEFTHIFTMIIIKFNRGVAQAFNISIITHFKNVYLEVSYQGQW